VSNYSYQPARRQPGVLSASTARLAPQSNGFAVAGRVLGIVPVLPLGLAFSIIGMRRSKTIGSGRRMAIHGIALGIMWIVLDAGIAIAWFRTAR
jgi:hypothetical protein